MFSGDKGGEAGPSLMSEQANKVLLLLAGTLVLLIFMDGQASRHYKSLAGADGGATGSKSGRKFVPVKRTVQDVFGRTAQRLVPGSTATTARTREFELYFIRFRRRRTQLVRVRRRAETPITPTESLRLLQKGPLPVERGLLTALGGDIQVNGVEVVEGTARVDLGPGVGRSSKRLVRARIEQILLTLGQFPSVRRIELLVDGARVNTIAGVAVRYPEQRRIVDFADTF